MAFLPNRERAGYYSRLIPCFKAGIKIMSKKVRVRFLLDKPEIAGEYSPENETVYALFPDEIYSNANPHLKLVHYISDAGNIVISGIPPEYARECKEATPEQYFNLKTKLEEGYELIIINETK